MGLKRFGKRNLLVCVIITLVWAMTAPCLPGGHAQDDLTAALIQKFDSFPWVAYSPTNYNPESDPPVVPADADMAEDLRVLYEAGFRGIVTYGAGGVLSNVPRLAREAGFEGVVMGIWTPGDPDETMAAVTAAADVDGYVVGNEGINFGRYDFDTLKAAIIDLREQTGKPVTTTDVVSLYSTDEALLTVGDWIFPTVHPYWQNYLDPVEAFDWTQEKYDGLQALTGDIAVVLKEVGLPTAGDEDLSEYQQAEYYLYMRDSGIRFVYFEAFDQPWKVEDGVGEHWGLFASDRTPKAAANYITKGYPPFYVYADFEAPDNHFVPEGWMGCYNDIDVDEEDQSNPHSGSDAIRITYTPSASCNAGWAGIYWWYPPGSDWCEEKGGYNLRGWTRLTFWARGENGGEIAQFKVGGLRTAAGDVCDSMENPKETDMMRLSAEWQQYTISLYRQDLSHIMGGFVWVTNTTEPTTTIYLDDIRFEWSEE
ncbi:MAG: hypothetical protein JXJ20_02075 [Anaerolineae bacterium]|nr:hypothetical protein [Anaerolineae bacterium]